jgi:hypothetical protein
LSTLIDANEYDCNCFKNGGRESSPFCATDASALLLVSFTLYVPDFDDKKRPVLLRGCFRVLSLYDVSEGFDLDKLRELLGPRGGTVRRVFPRGTPGYVRFEQPPIVEPAQAIELSTGERVLCSIKYYAFAVVVVQFEVPFDCDWDGVLAQASRWTDPADFEPYAREIARAHLERVAPAIIKPVKEWLHEGYLAINLEQVREADGESPTAVDLLSNHGPIIAQIVRGEVTPLASNVREEILQSSLSYYISDLVVVGASVALVYDRGEDAAATNQVLEYAKMQLLEFRYYDGLMTQLLSDVYTALERRRSALFSRWSVPRDAQHFNTIRLDVMELTERIDNAIKFVSDIYYARLYRMAATRMGVPDYRGLVDEKLRTVGELYDVMIDQFNEARSFIVEFAIAILALLDVLFLFRIK